MNELQRQIYPLLLTFAQLCEEHDLRYYLVGGTLLGAVRHRGFIPWDDDVDVAMPEEDYKTFLRLAASLPPHLVLESPETREDYPLAFCKLCDRTVPFETSFAGGPCGVYIDIFPLVPSRRPDRWTRALFNLQHAAVYVLQVRYGWQNFIPYKKRSARAVYALLDRLPAAAVKKLRDTILRSLRAEGTGYLFSPGGAYKADKEFYPEAWFASRETVTFEGRAFPGPCGWHEYLSRNYGDYMTLPPESERHSGH